MKKSLIYISIAIVCCFLTVPGVWGFDHGHDKFNSVLQEFVVVKGPQSSVRYGGIKQNPALLENYIGEIEGVTRAEFSSWNRDQQVAFLINAYNALTIKLILTKYPDLKSIRDLGGFFSGPWKIKFFTFLGEPRHLDHIEHEILRKDYTEPRIHFALVCAAVSCPPLQPEAYVPDRLDEQLNKAMISFLNDPTRNRFDTSNNRLYLSSIFKWFDDDFTKVKASVEAYVAPWITDDATARQLIADEKVDLEYLDYDWSLNRAD